eukprot:SAG22_NODE_11834_length_467_cov_0.970109_2_plen_59_part_01
MRSVGLDRQLKKSAKSISEAFDGEAVVNTVKAIKAEAAQVKAEKEQKKAEQLARSKERL